MTRSWVGVDVGGTKVLAVRIDASGEVQATATRPMPGRSAGPEAVEEAIVLAARDVDGGRPPVALGVSAAGLVDAAGERFLFGAHLPWRDTPVRRTLADRTGLTVVLDNDANCAAHAELVAGAARGVGSALLVTIGTGIGGAIVLDGRVVRGAHGLAGEFGHMQVVPDGLACECGLRGCWEQYCSGRALERVTRVALGRHLDGPEVTALARAGDPVALSSFASVGTWLGIGVAGLVSAFDPGLVVVGGGVSAVGELLLGPARTALVHSLQGTAYRAVPALVPALLGPEAGAIGAALLARDGRS
ncbi:ROK family protein [Nocardioides daeguensis]|uniref:ROK family glucokinase n=1 Tax=Nocardioides daeguensis TaxID=908359 RepID=A0ABP6UX71_9ACTN|nr:ROK family protein [Nocardioides daeguensis]MBV6725739.1 ROK family protein [Nocardioides daeguensis]MCR1772746.1 ROK family protein [Nocardioides daeguensis]